MVNHQVSMKMTRMAMYMNLALRSLHISREYEHQAKPHADFGIWLGLVPVFARDGERPTCHVHVNHAADAGWAARVLPMRAPSSRQ